VSAPAGGHVLVVGVDGVRFDFLGPEGVPSVWALGRAGFLAPVPVDEAGHGGREPEVATAWAAAAGPGIRPGAPPLITRQEEVAPLVLAAAGCPARRG
jgi:hypothetical protein